MGLIIKLIGTKIRKFLREQARRISHSCERFRQDPPNLAQGESRGQGDIRGNQ